MIPSPSRRVVLLALLWALLLAAGPARGITERRESVRVLGRLDREVITEFELARYMGRPVPDTGESLHPVVESALVELIVLKLEAREARSRNVRVTAGQVNAALARRIRGLGGPERFAALLEQSPTTVADLRRGLEDQLLVRRLYVRTASGPLAPGKVALSGRVRPEEARARYREHRGLYASPGKAHVALIEIRPRRDEKDGGLVRARAILERVRSGEDFAALARSESRGPRADEGGDLGWIEAGHLDPRIDAFVFAAEPGAVSEPIRTARGGWWIVRVRERNPGELLPFEEVVDRIAEEIRSERLKELRRTVLRRLVGEAVIQPAALRQRVLETIETIGEPVRP